MDPFTPDDELDDSIFYDVVELNVSVASNVLLEDSTMNASFSSVTGEEPLNQSTPVKSTQPGKHPVPSTSGNKVPQARLSCSKCTKTYANQRTLKVHLKMHAMKNVSSRTPGQTEMHDLTKEAIIKGCEEFQSEKCHRGTGLQLEVYCAFIKDCVSKGEGEALVELFCTSFMDIIRQQNVLLPSALRNAVYRLTNKRLTSQDFRKEMKEILKSMKDTSAEVLSSFVGCVGFKVITWQMVFVFRALRGQSTDREVRMQKYSADELHPQEYEQLIFYIGGAILKGILKKSKLYSGNPDWARLADVTTRKFIAKPFVHASNDRTASVTSFTEKKDRGGLTYCNQEAFDFFMHLFNLIVSVEEADGSLPTEKVENVVLDDAVLLYMWDDIVGVDLTEDQSIQLFSDIVRCCEKVAAKGILKKKLNEELLKSYSSIALRSKIAR